ncbi:MAG: thiamine diphosphokinase [Candidatus Cloacimonetes bacterium]|nr:thiamine diphosphokinase [Candidatus Cloacimonadota bacterium]
MSSERSICIIANGEKPASEVLKRALSGMGMVIAADGGSDHCRKMGVIPDVIIGDLDSTAKGIGKIFPDSEIIHLRDQETSDMEKAIEYAVTFKPVRINVISAMGKRTDHMLANILLFDHLNRSERLKDVEIHIYDNLGVIRFLAPGRHIIRNRRGRTVSFFSLGSISNLTLKGFRYNLENAEYKENFMGLSNVYESEECIVEFAGESLIWYECYEAEGDEIDE